MEGLEILVVMFLGGIAIYASVSLLLWILPYLLLAGAVVLGVCLLILIYVQREEIARWYYFTFYPHPAESVVRSVLAEGHLLDGERLAALLGEAPPDSRILREVRIAQGEQLVAQMQQASEQMVREAIRNAEADNARSAALGVQEAIALAAVALERAKAARAASQHP